MTNSYEQVFLALAMRNKLLSQEAAQACLAEFRANPEGSLEAIAMKHGLSEAHVQALQAGARKVMSGTTTQRVPPPPPGAPAAPTHPADPIPGHRIKGKLGVGGTATVFAADDVEHHRQVALKIMHPKMAKDEKALGRFLRESRLLVEFDHPNLVKGYACGQNGPLAWVAMEFLEGLSAQDILDQEKSISEARALEIILEAAKALEYMQSKGIVHRDIKPGNIMILKSGAIKVCDLGFAQEISGEHVEEETTSGTAQYMAPEQARGQGLDVRADIYSLGATLYHLVMGELPFQGGDSLEVMAKQVMEALNSSEIKNRRTSKHMHYFIERMMSKDKTLRYATPRELIDDITEQIEGFKALEFNPDSAANKDSKIIRLMGNKEKAPGEETPRGAIGPVTTRRFRKIDEITKRFKRDQK